MNLLVTKCRCGLPFKQYPSGANYCEHCDRVCPRHHIQCPKPCEDHGDDGCPEQCRSTCRNSDHLCTFCDQSKRSTSDR